MKIKKKKEKEKEKQKQKQKQKRSGLMQELSDGLIHPHHHRRRIELQEEGSQANHRHDLMSLDGSYAFLGAASLNASWKEKIARPICGLNAVTDDERQKIIAGGNPAVMDQQMNAAVSDSKEKMGMDLSPGLMKAHGQSNEAMEEDEDGRDRIIKWWMACYLAYHHLVSGAHSPANDGPLGSNPEPLGANHSINGGPKPVDCSYKCGAPDVVNPTQLHFARILAPFFCTPHFL